MSLHNNPWRTTVAAAAAVAFGLIGAVGVAAPASAEVPLESCVLIISTGESVCVSDAEELAEATEKELGLELVVEEQTPVDFGATTDPEGGYGDAATASPASTTSASATTGRGGFSAVAAFNTVGTASISTAIAPAANPVTTAYVRSILFEHSGYTGAIFTIADTNVCNAGGVSSITNLANYGWNDRVSSFASQYDCKTKLWHNSGYSGSSYGPWVKKSYVGDAHNDEFSSVKVYLP